MKKSKKKLKDKNQSTFKKKRLVIFLASIILSMGAIAGHVLAQSGDDGTQRTPSKTKKIQGSAPHAGPTKVTPINSKASFSLGELYEQFNCVCGRCNKVLAACGCQTAKIMKNEIAEAKRDNKAPKEIQNLMFVRYGTRFSSSKAKVAKRQPPLATPRPAIHVEPPTFDFGTIPQQVVTHSFTVSNKGDKDLIIGKVTTSCACTTAKMDKNTIPPGQDATLTVTFDPLLHNTKGKTRRTVFLQTNDPGYPVKKIQIKAFVKTEKGAADKRK